MISVYSWESLDYGEMVRTGHTKTIHRPTDAFQGMDDLFGVSVLLFCKYNASCSIVENIHHRQ